MEQTAHDAELQATAAEAELTICERRFNGRFLIRNQRQRAFTLSTNKQKWSARLTINWLGMG